MDASSKGYGESWLDKLRRLLDESGFAENLEKGDKVAIKQHMGEEGNVEYLPPPFARTAATWAKEAGTKPFLTDTTTLPYHPWTSRATATDHLRTATGNGFTQETIGCPIVIADGEDGTYDTEVTLPKGASLKRQFVAKHIVDSGAMIVLTHFKGHGMSPGCSGSIKNVGVGCASKRGKYLIHAAGRIQPVLDPAKCKGHECPHRIICEASCPEDAITVQEKARIDPDKCILCFSCINHCASMGSLAIGFPPGYKELEHTRIAESAYACLKGFRTGKVLFINVLKNLTAGCDCMPWAGAPKWPNQGITASYDLLATDQASLDLINPPPVQRLSEDLDILIQLRAAQTLFTQNSTDHVLARLEPTFTALSPEVMRQIRVTYKLHHPVRKLPEFNP
jgi:hypothetical protein